MEWRVTNSPITASKVRSADPSTSADLLTNSPMQADAVQPTMLKTNRIPFAKIAFTLFLMFSVGAGAALSRIVPINSLDWGGLLTGRKPEVLMEGLGRKLERPYQILVMGVDRVLDAPIGSPASFNGRSDSMLLIRVDPSDRRVHIYRFLVILKRRSPTMVLPKLMRQMSMVVRRSPKRLSPINLMACR